MDRAFVISGTFNDGKRDFEAAAALFTNRPLDQGGMQRLGFKGSLSVGSCKPLSQEPNEPTIYIFDRSRPGNAIEVIKLDWDGNEVGRSVEYGEPSRVIPPLRGDSAEVHIYPPKALLITGTMRESGRSFPVTAALFVKPEPGGKPLELNMKAYSRMGFSTIQTIESCETSARLERSVLYYFERSPNPSSVTMALLDSEGGVESSRAINAEPLSAIPHMGGSAVEKALRPRGSLCPSDFPRRRSSAPPRSERRKL